MKIKEEKLKTVIKKFSAILTSLDKDLQSFDPDKAELVFGNAAERKENLPEKMQDLDERFTRLIGYARDYQAHLMPQGNTFNGASVPTQ